MAQRRRKRSKKWLGKLVFVILLVVAVVVCYFVWDGYFRDKDEVEDGSGNNEPTKVIEKQDTVSDEGEKKEEKREQQIEQKEEVVQYDGDDPNKKEAITGVITYASVVNNNLMIRVNIDQYLASGECRLTLRRGETVVFEDSAAVIDAVSTATCEGFNMPVTSLGAGELEIGIVVNSGGKSGVISGKVGI